MLIKTACHSLLLPRVNDRINISNIDKAYNMISWHPINVQN